MISVVNEINKELDQGDDLKQVFRGDLSKKIAFEVKDESALQRIRGELSRQSNQHKFDVGKSLSIDQRIVYRIVYRPKRSSTNSRQIFYKVAQV